MARASRTPRSSPPAPPRPPDGLGPARRGGTGRIYTSPAVSIEFASAAHRLTSADLVIEGLYHGEASYEGRVFLNNPGADAGTARTLDNGYAGSFYVFGHGGCLGDPGHCEISGDREPYDLRAGHPLTPAIQRVDVTAAVIAIAKTSQQATVTVVPVISAANEMCDTENVFRCDSLKFVSYDL